jgi:hypothetical protein
VITLLLFVSALTLFGGITAAEAKDLPALGTERIQQLKDLEPWCDGPKTLAGCVETIIGTGKLVDEITREPGPPPNLGLSITGCYSYCELRYFPTASASDCRSTVPLVNRLAKTDRRLRDLRTAIARECSRHRRS